MNTKLPIQAKSTERILKAILPQEFKIVNDKNSNGYKFINLLYGVEIDEVRSILKNYYNDSFFTTQDLTKNFDIYEVSISGLPQGNYLNTTNGNIPIKITDEFEFYNGDPTRLNPNGSIPIPMHYLTYTGSEVPSGAGLINSFASGMTIECWGTLSGFVGLEYFRNSPLGSGYLLIGSDIDQMSGYISGFYPTFLCEVGTNFQSSGDYSGIYGFFTGIKTQDFNNNSRNEFLYPLDQKTLSGKYPLTREVIDESGIIWTIDHYTPYSGWIRNEYNEVIAAIDYSGSYYFDGDGNKIYYRTALNNPYGSGNYTTAYLDLEHVPISGTLRVFDIDILDISGNATEIPSSGKTLYYYKSPYMLAGSGTTDAEFDPIYLGYEQYVPSGIGFSSRVEGQLATTLKTTTWNYLHDGLKLSPALTYIDGSGDITNKISLSNYNSRYMVEYKYKIHDQIKYFSSIDSDRSISLHTNNPIYTVHNYSGALQDIDFEFTKDPDYITTQGNQSSKVLTFDGLNVRPNKILHKIEFNIPLLYSEGNVNSLLHFNIDKQPIGYSTEFIPQNSNFRRYVLNCPFDQNVVANTVTELDLTSSGNTLAFYNDGDSNLFKINFDAYFGKKIIRGSTGDSYFYKNDTSFLLDNTYFEFIFKSVKSQNIRLLELHDEILDKYILVDIDINGFISIQCDGYIFYYRDALLFDNNIKYLTIKYVADELSSIIPTFMLYMKNKNDLSYTINKSTKSTYAPVTVSSTFLNIFKNCTVDIGSFKIFYEVQ